MERHPMDSATTNPKPRVKVDKVWTLGSKVVTPPPNVVATPPPNRQLRFPPSPPFSVPQHARKLSNWPPSACPSPPPPLPLTPLSACPGCATVLSGLPYSPKHTRHICLTRPVCHHPPCAARTPHYTLQYCLTHRKKHDERHPQDYKAEATQQLPSGVNTGAGYLCAVCCDVAPLVLCDAVDCRLTYHSACIDSCIPPSLARVSLARVSSARVDSDSPWYCPACKPPPNVPLPGEDELVAMYGVAVEVARGVMRRCTAGGVVVLHNVHKKLYLIKELKGGGGMIEREVAAYKATVEFARMQRVAREHARFVSEMGPDDLTYTYPILSIVPLPRATATAELTALIHLLQAADNSNNRTSRGEQFRYFDFGWTGGYGADCCSADDNGVVAMCRSTNMPVKSVAEADALSKVDDVKFYPMPRPKSASEGAGRAVFSLAIVRLMLSAFGRVLEERVPGRATRQKVMAGRRDIVEGVNGGWVTNVRISLMTEGDEMAEHCDRYNRRDTSGFDYVLGVGSVGGGELCIDGATVGVGEMVVGNFRRMHSVKKVTGSGTRVCFIGWVNEDVSKFDELRSQGARLICKKDKVRMTKGKRRSNH